MNPDAIARVIIQDFWAVVNSSDFTKLEFKAYLQIIATFATSVERYAWADGCFCMQVKSKGRTLDVIFDVGANRVSFLRPGINPSSTNTFKVISPMVASVISDFRSYPDLCIASFSKDK